MKQHTKALVLTSVGLLSLALRAEQFQWKGVKFDLPGEYHAKIRPGIDSVGGEIVLKEPKLTILCSSGVGVGNVVRQRREFYNNKSKPLRDEKLKLGDLTCEIWIGGPYPQGSAEPYYDACAYVNGMNFVGNCQGDGQLKAFMSFVMSAKPVAVHSAGNGESPSRSNGDDRAEQPGAGQPATQPADEAPAKDQPSTPTSKDAPR